MPFLSDLVVQVYKELARRMVSDVPVGLTTGLPELDAAIGGEGWERQQLGYLVGDSGVGKSWLTSSFIVRGARHLYENPESRPASAYVIKDADDKTQRLVAEKEGKQPLLVFWSLEMSESPTVARLLAQMAADLYHTDIDSGKLMRGDLGGGRDSEQWNATKQRLADLYTLLRRGYGQHIYMEFEAQSVADFRKVLAKLAVAYDVCFVGVDYFRLVQEVSLDGNMATTQAGRSKKLRDLAKDFDCFVLSIFDITREGQKAGRIGREHMKGGTAANFDGDIVITLSIADDEEEEDDMLGISKTIHRHLVYRVAKNRNGPPTSVHLMINLATGHVEAYNQREDTIHTVGEPWDIGG